MLFVQDLVVARFCDRAVKSPAKSHQLVRVHPSCRNKAFSFPNQPPHSLDFAECGSACRQPRSGDLQYASGLVQLVKLRIPKEEREGG